MRAHVACIDSMPMVVGAAFDGPSRQRDCLWRCASPRLTNVMGTIKLLPMSGINPPGRKRGNS